MSLINKLPELEKCGQDEELILHIVEAVKEECTSTASAENHGVSGVYCANWVADGGYIVRKSKSEIPKNCDSGSSYDAYRIDDAEIFLLRLKKRIAALGFNSARCDLICRREREFCGRNSDGSNKYKFNGRIRYSVWIDISW